MNIHEMAETVTGWINSCKDESQLAVCQDIIDEYIDRRYKNHVSPAELATTLNLLRGTIRKRAEVVHGLGFDNL